VNPEQAFAVWAPEAARWSRWVKPVLFAHLAEAPQLAPATEPPPPQPFDVSRLRPADGTTVVIIDLPGAAGIEAGVALADAGYQPVPLYNSVPWPASGTAPAGGAVAVDMAPVMAALLSATSRLRGLRLRGDAPPAFLLDARRRVGDPGALEPPGFDNRSVSLPTDFPSANLLLSCGLRRVAVVQPRDEQPQADLAHTLRRWQEAGMEIGVMGVGLAAEGAGPPATPLRPIVVQKPKWYRHLWHAAIVRLGLRPNRLGGFGGLLPDPSGG